MGSIDFGSAGVLRMKSIESDSLSRKTAEDCNPGGIDSETRRV
jgi:hypothetical protein